ncbi:MAG: 1-(5-phosphoribosyl)-5-[(5-phosphoribosylamino)methylideneamino]imidazole-4-carboxamide isomerase [Clostridiaceae bacterium]|nr:1-(5-phosphoribosyl)-5-[(5-phosphoribosylamino)methylideneamino]imidazole-4-carboxamide isomerase [Clostridiaceae bacterium]
MIIYPAIDIRGAKCVRLTQGRYDEMTVFSDDPKSVALKFQSLGAKYLHIVDLDAARGENNNRELIIDIAKNLNIPVQTGGGIRSLEDIEQVLNSGIQRVIIGTTAVKNPQIVSEAVRLYGSKIAVGIDAKDGLIAIEGWENITDINAVEFAKKMESLGVQTVIYTDIATDGMLSGPNVDAMGEMVRETNLHVIASGGVAKIEDLRALKKTGVSGVIVGKALYTGDIDLNAITSFDF